MLSEKHRTDEDVTSDIAAGIEVLRRLVHGKHLDHGLQGITVTIGGDASTGGQGHGVAAKCSVSISADSKAHLDKIKKSLPGDGWTCTDGPDDPKTGNKTSVCENP
jgi:hypothetical protein